MIARALINYYRCPEELVRMSLAAELSGLDRTYIGKLLAKHGLSPGT